MGIDAIVNESFDTVLNYLSIVMNSGPYFLKIR
ncbi:hypothetical protein ABIB56_003165 [Glaciihabitans sp. UYNi722]